MSGCFRSKPILLHRAPSDLVTLSNCTMSSVQQDPNRMKGAGGGGVREQQHGGQEFDSWRHQQQQTHQPTGYNPMSSLASDPYGFYQQSAFHHYPGFGVGEGN